MSSISPVLFGLGALSLVTGSALAGDSATIRSELAKVIPDVKIDSVTPSPIDGLYEVMTGTQLMYVTGDGRYFFDGRIVDLKTRTDISEPRIAAARQQAIAKVGEDEMVIFAPDDYKYTVTVFTDIECGYCRKLHSQIDEYGDEGIRVRYLFYPRAGKSSSSYKDAVSVWCSDDRQTALTDAKSGKGVESKTCDNPVDEHMALGQELGVRGTPALVLESGEMVPGYVEPKRLSALLEKSGKP
mgnify:CR=1 FL=1